MRMEYTPLADPFIINFEKDGYQYEAKIVYAKSTTSCTNFFDVVVNKPKGIEPFCLKEKPVQSLESESMVWVDEHDKQSIFYQLIGNEIAAHLKNNLGIFLLDNSVQNDQEE